MSVCVCVRVCVCVCARACARLHSRTCGVQSVGMEPQDVLPCGVKANGFGPLVCIHIRVVQDDLQYAARTGPSASHEEGSAHRGLHGVLQIRDF